MLIAVDFDGTIVPDKFYPNKIPDEFMPGAKEALISLNAAGHTLVLWTLRDDGEFAMSRKLQIAADFLRRNGLGFIVLPNQVFNSRFNTWKLPVDLFIDDKIPGGFQGWDFILSSLGINNEGEPKILGGNPERNTSSDPGPNPVDPRTQQLQQQGVEPVGGSVSEIHESPDSARRTHLECSQDRHQAEFFPGCFVMPGNFLCGSFPPANNQGLFQQNVDRPLMNRIEADPGAGGNEGQLKFDCITCGAKPTANDKANG